MIFTFSSVLSFLQFIVTVYFVIHKEIGLDKIIIFCQNPLSMLKYHF